MSASAAILGKGTTFLTATASAGSYTAIGEMTDIGTPDPTPDDVEVTHFTSDNSYKEFIPGFVDGGEVSGKFNFLADAVTTIEGYRGTSRWWKVLLSDGSSYIFPGYLKKLTLGVPLKDKVEASFTIKVTGLHTYAAAA